MSLEHEMERVGRIVAADQSLQVHVRGVDAFAVPGEVTIPSIEQWKVLGPNAKRMLHGLLDHETAHSKWTDFDVMGAVRGDEDLLRKVIARYKLSPDELETMKKHPQLIALLANMVEDAVIERKQGEEWSGCRVNLQRKNQWYLETRTPSPDPIIEFIQQGCLYTRGTITKEQVTHPLVQKCFALLDRTPACSHTGDSLRLAIDIYRLLFDQEQEEEQEDEESQEGGEGDDSEPGDQQAPESPPEASGDPDDTEGGSDEESPDKGSEGQDQDPGEDSPPEDGDDGDDGDAESDESEDEGKDGGLDADECEMVLGSKDCPPLSPEDQVNAEIKAVFDQPDNFQPYTVFSHEFDIEYDFSTVDLKMFSSEIEEIREKAMGVSSALITAFETALKARREKRPIPGNDEGYVDPTMLAAYSLGAARTDEMYMQYAAEDDENVAAAILVDCSGSMGITARDEIARQAAYAMSEALTAVQIPHEITGFTCLDAKYTEDHLWCRYMGDVYEARRRFHKARQLLVEAKKRGVDVHRFARIIYEGHDPQYANLLVPTYAIFKSFAQDDLRGLTMLRGIHENLDGEAVLWQARRLAMRPEPRRVMFVLSDGQPLGSRNSRQGQRYLREAVPALTASGIEVIGIGIQTNAVERYYPDRVVVNDLDSLQSVGLTKLTEVLTQTRQEHLCVQPVY